MIIILLLFFFCLGLVVGSFLNVVILRYNTGLGIGGRSGCFSCGEQLAWYELIPVASFLIQRGRCRGCSARLSWQYPLVEFSTGAVFLGVFLRYALPLFSGSAFSSLSLATPLLFPILFFFVVWSLLIVIFVYDLRHRIIPDKFVYALITLSSLKVVANFYFAGFVWTAPVIAELVAGPALFLPFFILWHVSDGRWLGLGDGKLSWSFGWLLGLGLGTSAVVLGFWTGAIVGLGLLLGQYLAPHFTGAHLKSGSPRLTMKSEIPFAPFLIFGFALVYFAHIDVVGIYRIFGI